LSSLKSSGTEAETTATEKSFKLPLFGGWWSSGDDASSQRDEGGRELHVDGNIYLSKIGFLGWVAKTGGRLFVKWINVWINVWVLRSSYIIESLLSIPTQQGPRFDSRKKNSDEPYFFDGVHLSISFLVLEIHSST
jgi:hypothetical protein